MPRRATGQLSPLSSGLWLLDHLHPGELLGLTATPQRSDRVDVRSSGPGAVYDPDDLGSA